LAVLLASACGEDEPSGADAGLDAATADSGRPRSDAGGTPVQDAGALDAGGGGGKGPSGGASGGGADPDSIDAGELRADAGPPVSERCGDAIRDPLTEECDDGPGDASDACDEDCRAHPVQLGPDVDGASGAPSSISRELGLGPHVVSASKHGFAVTYVEQADGTSVWVQLFDARGGPRGGPIDVGDGTLPMLAASPVVAALPSGAFAVAWSETSGGMPDVAMRLVDGPEEKDLGAVSWPHDGRSGPQDQPDLLWTGSELIVAWSDRLDVKCRRFDESLEPLAQEQALGTTAGIESSVVLASFGTSWAAAWRAGDQGLERVRVVADGVGWVTPAGPPGPEGDRPTLLTLDDEHLLLVYTVGTDPLGSGTANVGRLRAAVLDTASPGEVDPELVVAIAAPYSTDDGLSQRRPGLVRVGDELFLVWESTSPLGDARANEILLQSLAWTPDDPELLSVTDERSVPTDAPTDGDQQNPRLGASPLFPGGALIVLFEDHTGSDITRPLPDVSLALRPIPWVTLDH
jgi:hypothetical protein